jgi:HSP20 family protein
LDLLAGIGPVLNPRFDLFEVQDRFILFADLPGLQPEDLDIELQGGALIVSGERDLDPIPASARLLLLERSCGTFCRTFQLPAEVAGADAAVWLEHGVLRIEVPKRSSDQNPPQGQDN